MTKVLVKPLNNAVLIDPSSNQTVPKDGVKVKLDTYWRRRIADGDAEVVKEKRTTKPKVKESPDLADIDLDIPDDDKEDK